MTRMVAHLNSDFFLQILTNTCKRIKLEDCDGIEEQYRTLLIHVPTCEAFLHFKRPNRVDVPFHSVIGPGGGTTNTITNSGYCHMDKQQKKH